MWAYFSFTNFTPSPYYRTLTDELINECMHRRILLTVTFVGFFLSFFFLVLVLDFFFFFSCDDDDDDEDL